MRWCAECVVEPRERFESGRGCASKGPCVRQCVANSVNSHLLIEEGLISDLSLCVRENIAAYTRYCSIVPDDSCSATFAGTFNAATAVRTRCAFGACAAFE